MNLGLKIPRLSFTGDDAGSLRNLVRIIGNWTRWHYVQLTFSGTQNLASATNVDVTWSATTEDDSQLHDASSVNVRVPSSHQSYVMSGAVGASADGAGGNGKRTLAVHVDGAAVQPAQSADIEGVAWHLALPIETAVREGSAVKVVVRNDSAGTDVMTKAYLALKFIPMS